MGSCKKLGLRIYDEYHYGAWNEKSKELTVNSEKGKNQRSDT